jgi:ufm1-conjugating enzyme 1
MGLVDFFCKEFRSRSFNIGFSLSNFCSRALFQFDVPATYPTTAPEIEIPELEGKTAKMYRGGKICLTIHFKPLWAKNAPHFGIAHALCLGLAPWLAAEVPYLVESGAVLAKT